MLDQIFVVGGYEYANALKQLVSGYAPPRKYLEIKAMRLISGAFSVSFSSYKFKP